MNKAGIYALYLGLMIASLCLCSTISAQMITGTWKGKINRQKAEVKIIQTGDSLTGTSYYYESASNYRRYSIKGYFDSETNSAVWWDDQLLEEKSGRFSISIPGKVPLLSRADFNCPGGGKIMLDGKVSKKEDNTNPTGEVHLDKTGNPEFEDEWDFVIDNYTVGANNPEIIDSIAGIALRTVPTTEPPKTIPVEKPIIVSTPPPVQKIEEKPIVKPEIPKKEPEPVVVIAEPVNPPTIEEKFTSRKKVLIKEIPLSGDSLELRFYDNAEIDGDSISLFLNDKLLFQHIRLTGNAYSIKLSINELNETNELIMVAENLGAIPPNTSYMLALVGDKRYDAYLASTEGSSAMIRFIKKAP
ncbi:MAG: hypothetical protein SGI83_19770 [Bacteroidota bacterium]|nr:hypothetical protein [Bacteroidota bacterium]